LVLNCWKMIWRRRLSRLRTELLIWFIIEMKNKVNLSTYLSEDLSQDYSSLSKLFSERRSHNWALFYSPKDWKAKELLVYDELSE
jgi:hypothetical protein